MVLTEFSGQSPQQCQRPMPHHCSTLFWEHSLLWRFTDPNLLPVRRTTLIHHICESWQDVADHLQFKAVESNSVKLRSGLTLRRASIQCFTANGKRVINTQTPNSKRSIKKAKLKLQMIEGVAALLRIYWSSGLNTSDFGILNWWNPSGPE